uniref:Uncharacterized protein n=1 Tax=Anguilla anguilla TaxID=7936 RepID=A0A0E9U6U8_ANGAN
MFWYLSDAKHNSGLRCQLLRKQISSHYPC